MHSTTIFCIMFFRYQNITITFFIKKYLTFYFKSIIFKISNKKEVVNEVFR